MNKGMELNHKTGENLFPCIAIVDGKSIIVNWVLESPKFYMVDSSKEDIKVIDWDDEAKGREVL